MPTFDTPAPISVTVDIIGDARITASDRTDTVVTVRPRDPSDAADRKAAEQTVVECTDGRLRVSSARRWTRYRPFGGGESVEVTIEVPTGSRLEARSGLGDLHAEGELGASRVKTAMGDIRLDHTGDLRASTGHGDVTVDSVAGDVKATTGTGAIRIGHVDGEATIRNSNGETVLGHVTGEVRVKGANGGIAIDRGLASVTAKTANGDIRLHDVHDGSIELETAVGEVEIGVPEGVTAWLDLTARRGSVRNELDDTAAPDSSDRTIEVRARSHRGDIVVHRSPLPDVPHT